MKIFLSILAALFSCMVSCFASETTGCCQSIKLESGGGADFYQHELLGSYGQVGMSHGKPAYGQINGRYYLYWLPIGVWTVGNEIGNDNSAGLRYVGDVSCPEYSGETWEYWSEWRDEWVEDWSTEATCSGPSPTPGPAEPCATGSLCDGCSNTAWHDGVTYCCAKDCNSGSISVHTENGDVVCECRH